MFVENKIRPPERIEDIIDQRTVKLLYMFRIINSGRFVQTSDFGEMRESVVLAALLHGARRGEVEFDWVKGRPKDSIVLQAGFKEIADKESICITIDERLLEVIQDDLLSIGGVLPIGGRVTNVFAGIKKTNRDNHWRIRGWSEILTVVSIAYSVYRQI